MKQVVLALQVPHPCLPAPLSLRQIKAEDSCSVSSAVCPHAPLGGVAGGMFLFLVNRKTSRSLKGDCVGS